MIFKTSSSSFHYFYYEGVCMHICVCICTWICVHSLVYLGMGSGTSTLDTSTHTYTWASLLSASEGSVCSAGDTGDMGSVPGLWWSPGVRYGNPLQYSCMKNPMDRGAPLAIVHGVTKRRTWLSMHVCVHTRTHTHTYTYIHTYIYIYIYTVLC